MNSAATPSTRSKSPKTKKNKQSERSESASQRASARARKGEPLAAGSPDKRSPKQENL